MTGDRTPQRSEPLCDCGHSSNIHANPDDAGSRGCARCSCENYSSTVPAPEPPCDSDPCEGSERMHPDDVDEMVSTLEHRADVYRAALVAIHAEWPVPQGVKALIMEALDSEPVPAPEPAPEPRDKSWDEPPPGSSRVMVASDDDGTLTIGAPGFTCIRACRHCGVLLTGGPTACTYCVNRERALAPVPAPEPAPEPPAKPNIGRFFGAMRDFYERQDALLIPAPEPERAEPSATLRDLVLGLSEHERVELSTRRGVLRAVVSRIDLEAECVSSVGRYDSALALATDENIVDLISQALRHLRCLGT